MTAPAQVHVTYPGDPKGGYQVVRSENGGLGPHTDLGPRWPTPKEACRYADLIDRPFVTPLSGAEPATSPGSASVKAANGLASEPGGCEWESVPPGTSKGEATRW